MNKKERHKKLLKDHYNYIKSLGVNIDTNTGEIEHYFDGYEMPDLSCGVYIIFSDKF